MIDLLSSELRRGGLIVPIDKDTYIELGEGNFKTQVGELPHARGEVLRHASGNEVGLEAWTTTERQE